MSRAPRFVFMVQHSEYPVSEYQDNSGELRENRRRRSRFILPAPRHLAAVAVGGVLAALLVHYLGFIVLSWFDLGFMSTRLSRRSRLQSRFLRKSF